MNDRIDLDNLDDLLWMAAGKDVISINEKEQLGRKMTEAIDDVILTKHVLVILLFFFKVKSNITLLLLL